MIENKFIEFKLIWKEEFLKQVSAFANAEGGIDGKFPPEVKIEDLQREHLSVPHNKLIADVFYKAGFIESWGRGTIRMAEYCIADGIPVPEHTENNGVIKILFKNKEDTNYFINEGLNEGLKTLFKIISEHNGIQAKDLSDKLKRPLKTVERQLSILIGNQYIERKGSRKTGGYYVILKK